MLIFLNFEISFNIVVMGKTYHTNTKLAQFFGVLDKEIAIQIPRSTLNDWNKINVSNIFGLDYACDKQNKK